MTTKKIFFASLLIGMIAIQAATAQAQSNPGGVLLPQNEELKLSPVEEICRLYLLNSQVVSECSRSKPPQLKGSWMITFTPRSESEAPPFTSLATFTPDGGVINSAAGITIGGVAINTMVSPANVHNPAITRGDGFAPGYYLPGSASPGMGEWVTAQTHEFAITYAHLLYDGLGQHAGVAKVRASLKIYREASD